MIYAKSRSKPAKSFGTASKDQQIFIRLKKLLSDVSQHPTDTFSSEFISNFISVSPIENQFYIALIINLNFFLIKLKKPRSTGNVKRGVTISIVNAHNSSSAFSAKQNRNNNRIFVLRKIPFFVYASQILTSFSSQEK